MDKVYSLDGERYFDWEDIIDHIKSECMKGDLVTLYEADQVNHDNTEFIDSHQIIESISECAFDEGGEFTENYHDDLMEINEDELGLLISNWLDSKGVKPEFFTVENVKETEYTVE